MANICFQTSNEKMVWQDLKKKCGDDHDSYSESFNPHGRRNSCPRSCIHLFDTHFDPTSTGQAAWRVSNIPSPFL